VVAIDAGPVRGHHPSRQNGPLTAAERRNADDALQLELTLARAAIERGDRTGRDTAGTRGALGTAALAGFTGPARATC
jgi:hypothetical protein